MAAHLSQEQIDQYKRRRLAPDELLWVDDHISECVDCRQRIASGAELWAAFQSKPLAETSVSSAHADLKGKHLTYEELEVLVDGKMGDKQAGTLRAHLEFCQSCSEELRDLNSLKVELDSAKGRTGWWPRFAFRWFSPRRIAFALGTCAIIVVAIAAGIRRMGITKEGASTETANTRPVEPGGSANPLPGVKELAPDEQVAIAEALANTEIKLPTELQEAQRSGAAEVLLGPAEDTLRFKVLRPIGEVVADDRPNFHWQPLAKAKSYSVAIFDARLNPVLSSPPLHATEWKAARPLNRGQSYLWQVTAQLRDGKSVSAPSPPSPEAKFRILDQEKAGQITHFQKAHPESHIILGILYAQAGVLEKAKEELKLTREGDPNYGLAQKLLKNIQEIQHPQP